MAISKSQNEEYLYDFSKSILSFRLRKDPLDQLFSMTIATIYKFCNHVLPPVWIQSAVVEVTAFRHISRRRRNSPRRRSLPRPPPIQIQAGLMANEYLPITGNNFLTSNLLPV